MTNMSIFLVFLLCDFSLNFDVKTCIDLTIVSHFFLLLNVYIFLMFFVWAVITYSIVMNYLQLGFYIVSLIMNLNFNGG